MKPFRIYLVVAGGLEKVRNRIRFDYDTLEEAEAELNRLRTTKWKYWKPSGQYCIQHYQDNYRAKIVKLVDFDES